MRKIISVFLLIFPVLFCFSQPPNRKWLQQNPELETLNLDFEMLNLEISSPYRLGLKQELPFIGAGGLTLGVSAYLQSNATLFTPDELESLDPFDVNGLDRIATHFYSPTANDVSYYMWYGSHAMPFLLLSGKRTRRDFGKVLALYGETMMLTTGTTLLFKHTFYRPRPYVFNWSTPIDDIQTVKAKVAFFSGHTSMTAANTFFAAKVFADYYPDSKWKPAVWTLAATIPAVTGYLRVRAGRHYPTDVLTGYVVGGLIGYFVPHLHKNKQERKKQLNVYVIGNRVSLWYDF